MVRRTKKGRSKVFVVCERLVQVSKQHKQPFLFRFGKDWESASVFVCHKCHVLKMHLIKKGHFECLGIYAFHTHEIT